MARCCFGRGRRWQVCSWSRLCCSPAESPQAAAPTTRSPRRSPSTHRMPIRRRLRTQRREHAPRRGRRRGRGPVDGERPSNRPRRPPPRPPPLPRRPPPGPPLPNPTPAPAPRAVNPQTCRSARRVRRRAAPARATGPLAPGRRWPAGRGPATGEPGRQDCPTKLTTSPPDFAHRTERVPFTGVAMHV